MWDIPVFANIVITANILLLQGFTIRPFRGCKNAAGKLRQKREATPGTKFTKPQNGLTEMSSMWLDVGSVIAIMEIGL